MTGIEWLSIVSGLGAGATSAAMILIPQRRALPFLLGLQFVFVAALLMESLPAVLPLAYLVAGLTATGILFLSWRSVAQPGGEGVPGLPKGIAFRLVSVLLVGVAASGLAGGLRAIVPALSTGAALGSSWLLGFALLQIGLSEDPVRVGTALIGLVGAFEVSYSALEPSIALHGLMSTLPLLLALVVGYLMLTAGRLAGGSPR